MRVIRLGIGLHSSRCRCIVRHSVRIGVKSMFENVNIIESHKKTFDSSIFKEWNQSVPNPICSAAIRNKEAEH